MHLETSVCSVRDRGGTVHIQDQFCLRCAFTWEGRSQAWGGRSLGKTVVLYWRSWRVRTVWLDDGRRRVYRLGGLVGGVGPHAGQLLLLLLHLDFATGWGLASEVLFYGLNGFGRTTPHLYLHYGPECVVGGIVSHINYQAHTTPTTYSWTQASEHMNEARQTHTVYRQPRYLH